MSSAPDAAAAAAAAATTPVEEPFRSKPVDISKIVEDPVMKEAYEDQVKHAEDIANLRKEMAAYFEENKEAELVQELLVSDRSIYRFLKARQFKIPKAIDMIKEAITWRKDNDMDNILKKPCPLAAQWKKNCLHGWHNYDYFGRPIFVELIGAQDFKTVSGTGTVEERVYYANYQNEYFRKYVIPEANRLYKPAIPVDQVCTIVDMKGFHYGLVKKFNYNWVQAVSKINSLIYPEHLGQVFIINCPTLFSMVWAVVKPWLDERTRAKCQIFRNDGREALSKICDYDSLPLTIGGKCQCAPKEEGGCIEGSDLSVAFLKFIEQGNNGASPAAADAAAAASSSSSDAAAADADAEEAAIKESIAATDALHLAEVTEAAQEERVEHQKELAAGSSAS